MQLGLRPHGRVPGRGEARRDGFYRESAGRKPAEGVPSRPPARRLVDDVDLVAVVEEPGCPASATVRLIQPVLFDKRVEMSTRLVHFYDIGRKVSRTHSAVLSAAVHQDQGIRLCRRCRRAQLFDVHLVLSYGPGGRVDIFAAYEEELAPMQSFRGP